MEQIRAQSAQPYPSKLQRALAARMDSVNKAREYNEVLKEKEREKAVIAELENKLSKMKEELEEIENEYKEEKARNETLQTNIGKMMDATKKLHDRHLALMSDLEKKKARLMEALANKEQSLWNKLHAKSNDL